MHINRNETVNLSHYLVFYEHVEKLVTRFPWTARLAQVSHVVLRYSDAQPITYTGSLVVQSAALRAGYQVKELLCLGERDKRGSSRQ